MTRVVFILSTNYAGSHLLTQMLGAHSKCLSVGELKQVRKIATLGREGRGLRDFSENPIFQGLEGAKEFSWHGTILKNAEKIYPGTSILIDNSKKWYWASGFERHPEIRPVYVHLIRDPRALLRRWLIEYDTPKEMRRQRIKLFIQSRLNLQCLFADKYQLLLKKWLLENRRISAFMAKQGQLGNVITYCDLVMHTESTLRQVMSWLGEEFESGQLNYGTGKNFGTHKPDYREQSSRSEIFLDDRWKNDLPVEIQERVAFDKQLVDYLETIGVRSGEYGLTRHT